MFQKLCVVLLICWFGAVSAVAQSLESFNLEDFNTVADRSRSVLDNEVASDEALLDMRAVLVSWREAANAAEDRRRARVETAQNQLNALGPAPADGAVEAPATASQREVLTLQLSEAQSPLLEAQSAFERANGLIAEIDNLLRNRQTERIIAVGPNPLAPQNWVEAGRDVTAYFSDISDEVRDTIARPASRQLVAERLPVTIIYLVIAFVLMWPQRGLLLPQKSLRIWDHVRTENLFGSSRGWLTLFRSVLLLALPLAGIWLATYALNQSGLFGLNGQQVLQGLPLLGFCVAAGIWLGWILRVELPKADDKDPDPKRMQMLATYLGIGIGIASFLRGIFGTADAEVVTNAVLRFPLILLFAAGLAAVWFLTKPLRWLGQALIKRDGPLARVMPFLRFGILALAIAMPLISVVGYGLLAANLLLATLLTLALLTTCYAIFKLITHISVSFEASPEASDADERNVGVLLRFALGSVIAVMAAPLFALIWGARVTDLQELWSQFQNGFAFGDTRVSPSDLFTLLIVFAVGYTITRVVQSALRKTVLPNTSLDKGAQYALVAGTGYVGIFLAAVVAISATGLDLSSLAIIFGALSVGIGFGLQNIVSNFISGIILLVERPIKEGDWIEVGGQHGTVRNISVRSTEIEAFDRSMVIIPNSDLMTGTLTNYTHRSLVGRVIVPVGVSYDADPREVERILLEIAEDHPRVLLNPAPYVVFQGFGASSMDFEVRAILRDVNYVLTVRSDMNFEIAKRFKEAGIEIPFAQSDVTIRNLEEVKDLLS